MNFSQKIMTQLSLYHARKGLRRLLLGDHPAIKALLNLPIADRNNPWKLYQCFIKHPSKPSQASYDVGNAIFNELVNQTTEPNNVLDMLYNRFQDKKLLTQDHRDAMRAHVHPKNLARALHHLYDAKFLTKKNIDAVIAHANPENLVKALHILHETKRTIANYRDIVIAHANPEGLAKGLSILHKTKLNTLHHRNAIINSADPENLAKVLHLLHEVKLLTPNNYNAIITYAHPETLLTALHSPAYAKYLTQKNIDDLLKTKGTYAKNLANALNNLYRSKVLKSENIEAVIAHTQPQNLVRALRTMDRTKFLTLNHRDTLISHANPENLANALCILNNAKLLTPKHHDALIRHAHPENLANAFCFLNEAKLLTPEHRDALITHPYPEHLANAFCFLNEAKLLTPDHRDALITNHGNPQDFAEILRILNQVELLTPNNRDAIKAHPFGRFIYDILPRLKNATPTLLTQENLNQLLSTDNDLLLSQWGYMTIWYRMPHHLWHQDTFNEFIRLAQQENPQQEIEQYINRLLVNAPNARDINDAQSIHNIAVEKSTSECVIRLKKHYGTKIEGDRLHQTLNEVKTYISNLSDDNICNQAAKRCIKRLFLEENSYFHGILKITTLELLALVFIATHDNTQRISTLEDALAQLVSILYRIQRGDNFSKKGIDHDTTSTDRPICTSGTFGMLAHSLDGFHKLFKHLFMNERTASLKLLALVREKAQEHLLGLADNIQTTQDFIFLLNLIHHIERGGIDIIFDAIKKSVADCMFDEFYMLYNGNRKNQKFNDDVNAGKDAELTQVNVSVLKTKIYRKLVPKLKLQFPRSNLMSLGFGTLFLPCSYTNYWIQNRHNNSEIQKEYDKRFGVAVS